MEITSSKALNSHKDPYFIKPLIGLCTICAIAIFFLTVTTAQSLPVILPTVVIASAVIVFFLVLRQRRRGVIPFFEIGAFYVTVVSVYSLYPLIGFLANGLTYSPLNDARLFQAQPTPQDIGTVGWYYAIYILSFIVVYLTARGKLPLGKQRFTDPSKITIVVIIALYITIKLFLFGINWLYDLSYSTYGESYLVLQRLPTLIAQFFGHFQGASFTLELLILAVLFLKYKKYNFLIYGWLFMVATTSFLKLGSRTELFLLLISAAILYHTLVKPLKFSWIILGGILVLALFTILGIIRGYSMSSNPLLGLNFFNYSSEFEVVFANAYDLSQLKSEGLIDHLPISFYLADFLALFPQQVLPIEKIDPSSWYVNKFYPEYAALGGGLALGAISESILGWGWIDLIWRGSALGYLLGQLHRYYSLSRPSLWTFTFYIWVTVLSYQLFRTTTFSLLPLFFYRFIPFVLIIKTVAFFLKKKAVLKAI